MNGIKEYIKSVNIKDIPWNRMATAYGTAKKYPEYLAVLDSMQNIKKMQKAFDRISDFEHQSTMFPPAPFVLVFLVRILEKAKNTDTPEAEWLVSEMSKSFDYYLEVFEEADSMEHAEPLPNFSDMLDEEYLLEGLTEDDLEEYDENFMSDENYFYSLYYYSKKVISGTEKD
ncbi:MAG: hypothetical protein K2O29_07540 [Ruminococcus sp.]|nr:hypothetical protein [Ruminococcus sp.]MDE6849391.1 hypothetical protein [Ruminococcus sp.]MDE7138291.1 hypothetical protein [Ruminococcus sp.]